MSASTTPATITPHDTLAAASNDFQSPTPARKAQVAREADGGEREAQERADEQQCEGKHQLKV